MINPYELLQIEIEYTKEAFEKDFNVELTKFHAENLLELCRIIQTGNESPKQ